MAWNEKWCYEYTHFLKERQKQLLKLTPPKTRTMTASRQVEYLVFFASYLWLESTCDVPMVGSKIRKCRCCCILSHFLLRNYNMLMLRSKNWKGIHCCLLDRCWLFNYDVLMSRSKIWKGICCSLFGHC